MSTAVASNAKSAWLSVMRPPSPPQQQQQQQIKQQQQQQQQMMRATRHVSAQRNSLAFLAYHYFIGSERHSLLFWLYRQIYWLLVYRRRMLLRLNHTNSSNNATNGADNGASVNSSQSSSVPVTSKRRAPPVGNGPFVLEYDVLSPSRAVTQRGVAAVADIDGTGPMASGPSTPSHGARPIVSAGGLEGEEPGLHVLFDVDVSQLSAEQLRVRMEDAQRAFKRQNARLAHLRSARQRAQQVMEAESHLRTSAERSVEVLEAELNRLRTRNTQLADQLHAREVQLNRINTPLTTPRHLLADALARRRR
jgi:hypothetical protein